MSEIFDADPNSTAGGERTHFDIDRFGNGKPTAQIEIRKAVEPLQLKSEVEGAVGHPVNMTLTSVCRPSEMSEEKPGILYLQPETIDLAKVQVCLDQHQMDPNYGKTPAELQAEQAVQKMMQGEEVSHEDLVSIIQGLLSQP